MRILIRQKYRPYHDREILQSEAELAAAILASIDARGPLSSLDFEDRQSLGGDTWVGQTRTKRILRSLWVSGQLVTHHRRGGRHYCDRPERVIPPQHFHAPPLLDEEAYHRWILTRRHQATGLLPRSAAAAIWSGCGTSAQNRAAVAQLVEAGTLTPVHVGPAKLVYHLLSASLDLLAAAPPPSRVLLLGPLDSMLWDRRTLKYVFDFDYIWEVYKPQHLRRWGYYVLPVFYGERFVARVDTRLEKNIWSISRWWWEERARPDADLYAALSAAAGQFMRYLRARGVSVSAAVEPQVRAAILRGCQ
jgi:uncharacterized protein